ncbi:MAG: hypothetical protein LAO08_07905 [Acidobacteriia bacterium]|nr:hypothetical protein [Terriglobia bacterium]
MAKWGLLVLGVVLGFMVGFRVAAANYESQKNNASLALNGRIAMLQGQMQSLTQAKETCEAKFQRATVLYDGILFQGRRWIIPADVEPIYLGQGGQADYTHIDPKTQTETVHMKPKQQ